MSAALLKEKREILLNEIANIMETWPERQRQVFSLVHYDGKSPAAISRTMAISVEDVRSILEKCDRQLHGSLRSFHKTRLNDTSSAATGPVVCTKPKTSHPPGPQTACG